MAFSVQRQPRPLFDWAYCGDFPSLLEKLSKIALPEKWYYGSTADRYPKILDRYLHYTFERLQDEDKIGRTNDFATFNTGLVDRKYEPIFMLFKRETSHKTEWQFAEFAIAGEDWQGKKIVSEFNPLPDRAKYFENITDAIYDTSAGLPVCDYEHILLERIDRLPIEFVEDNCPKGFSVQNTNSMTGDEKREYFGSLSMSIQEDTRKLRAMVNRLRDAVALAIKRVEWNYKTAIPMYYPTNKSMSLLLPLSLVDEFRVDIALVTEKTPSGSCLGHTILSLEMAYSNARLITRPDSDWLSPEMIEMSQIDDNS